MSDETKIDEKVLEQAKEAWQKDQSGKKFRELLAKNNIADDVGTDEMKLYDRLEMEWVMEQRNISRRGR